MISFFKQPGSLRIVAGLLVVSLLLFMAAVGEHLLEYTSSEMDRVFIMEPPSIRFFSYFLITEKGLKNLGRGLDEASDAVSPDGTPGQSESTAGAEKSASAGSEASEEHEEDFSYLSGSDADQPEPTENNSGPDESPSGPAAAQQDEAPAPSPPDEVPDGKYSYLRNHPRPAPPVQKQNRHYFGTDKDGRDILALLVAGAKTSILPGLITCLVALCLGFPLGMTAGYYGGRWADIIHFSNSIILSFPRFILILVVICALEPNVYITMTALGITIIPRVSELMRTRVRALSAMGFVLAAKESGLSDWKILIRHLFWFQNRTVFFIQASLIMSESILVETTLSYLQFGTKPPHISWGNVIEGSRLAFFSEYYWVTFFPAAAIVIAILGFFYLGDGLNARLEYIERS